MQLEIGNKEECRLTILTNKGNEKFDVKNLVHTQLHLNVGANWERPCFKLRVKINVKV